jgi:hypothetical protein
MKTDEKIQNPDWYDGNCDDCGHKLCDTCGECYQEDCLCDNCDCDEADRNTGFGMHV